jgi:hypothetical protein
MDFRKNSQISNLIKIRQPVAELFLADGQKYKETDGQTDMTKLIVAFRNFAKAPKTGTLNLLTYSIFIFI